MTALVPSTIDDGVTALKDTNAIDEDQQDWKPGRTRSPVQLGWARRAPAS